MQGVSKKQRTVAYIATRHKRTDTKYDDLQLRAFTRASVYSEYLPRCVLSCQMM